MEKQLAEYYSLEQDYDNQSLFVNKKSMIMKLWTLLAAIVLIITLKNMYFPDSPPIFFTGFLIIIIVMIIFTVF
jgi:membrane protein YdbS with pleckstrin-like domain